MKQAVPIQIAVTPAELHAIKESVGRARGKIIADSSLAREFYLMKAREGRLKREKHLQERMLLSLQCTEKKKRDIRLPPIDKVILDALKNNDIRFFVRLGRVLGGNSFDETYEGPQPSRLTNFLLSHWAESKDNLPEFFKLTRKGLVAVCSHCLKNEKLSADAIVKLRQRLGLKTIRGRKLDVIVDGNTLRFFQKDKIPFSFSVHASAPE